KAPPVAIDRKDAVGDRAKHDLGGPDRIEPRLAQIALAKGALAHGLLKRGAEQPRSGKGLIECILIGILDKCYLIVGGRVGGWIPETSRLTPAFGGIVV